MISYEPSETRVSARPVGSPEEGYVTLTFHGAVGDTTLYLHKRLAHDIIEVLNNALSEI